MKIYVGFDHRGRKLANEVIAYLVEQGFEVNLPYDSEEEKINYPDVCLAVCKEVVKNKENRAILICGTGIGMAMASNRFNKIRAVLCHSQAEAYFARRHEDSNVLALSAGYSDGKMEVKASVNKALKIIDTFLQTEFEGGRHLERVNFLDKLNQKD